MILHGLACLFMLLKGASPPPELTPGTTLQGSIRSGETQVYSLHLAAGKVAELVIEQGATDLGAKIVSGETLPLEIDARENGPEPFIIKAGSDATYLIEVKVLQKRPWPTPYTIVLRSVREGSPDDDLRLIAERKATEAKQADSQRSSDALRQGVAAGLEALQAWRRLGDRSAQAAALTELATLHIYLAKLEDARAELVQALPMARATRARWTEAEALTNLGHVYFRLSLLEEAKQSLQEAIPLWRELGSRYAEAATLNNLGQLYNSAGSYQQALHSYQQSRAIAISLNDADHEGYTEANLAGVYTRLADRPAVIHAYKQSIVLFRKAGDHFLEGESLLSLSTFYLNEHKLQTARTFAQRARVLFEKTGNDDLLGSAWKRSGDISVALNETARAVEEYQQAITNYRRASSPAREAEVLVSFGTLYADLGNYDRAKDHFDQALAILRPLGRKSGEANALIALGLMYKKSRDYDLSIARLTEALTILSGLGTPATQAAALFELASAEREAGRLGDAEKHIQQLLGLVESSRALVAGPQLRMSYLASKKQYYEFAQDLYVQLERESPGEDFSERGLEAVERSRARSLLDSIDEASLKAGESIQPELAGRRRELREQLNFWSERLTDTSTKGNAVRHKEAADKLEVLLAKYHELESQIRDGDPQYALLTPHLLRVADIRREVLDPETVLLEYSLGERSSHLWVLTSDSLKLIDLPGRTVIESEVGRFYRLARQVNKEPTPALAREMKQISWRLSRMLLGPATSQIKGKRLLIAADTILERVPFAALPSPESGAPLILSHELVCVPSASVLAEQRRLAPKDASASKVLAVIADPVFDPGDVRTTNPQPDPQPRFARLPFTRAEARAILDVASKNNTLAAFDFDADRTLFTSNRLSQYKIVHIATHAVTDQERPELSSLVFSQVNRSGTRRAGHLHLYEIASLRLRADLVTLSACGTGLGKSMPGEGTIGLAWAFLHAGAKTVVVSLWDVEDESTAELMRLFYQNLLGIPHIPPAAALRRAQLSMLRMKPSSVYSWSAWTVIGDWHR